MSTGVSEHCIGNVDARRIDARRFQQPQQAARRADEGTSRQIFFISWLLSDDAMNVLSPAPIMPPKLIDPLDIG